MQVPYRTLLYVPLPGSAGWKGCLKREWQGKVHRVVRRSETKCKSVRVSAIGRESVRGNEKSREYGRTSENAVRLTRFHFFPANLPVYFSGLAAMGRFQKLADSFPDCFTPFLPDSQARPVVEHKGSLHSGEGLAADLLHFCAVAVGTF